MPRLLFHFAIAIASTFFLCVHAQEAQEDAPTLSVSLPADFPSEKVEIHYFLVGPFGGHGGYVKPQPNLHSYEFSASVDGKTAASAKIIVYASGCGFQTHEFDLSKATSANAQFVCETLPMVTLSGQIQTETVLDQDAELTVDYLAFWSHSFFGIMDGPVSQFQVATATPDSDGRFRVEIPDFTLDHTTTAFKGNASFQLRVRNRKTWNPIISSLQPLSPEFKSGGAGLRIQSHYPADIKFVSEAH
jgi:hypothetical protein